MDSTKSGDFAELVWFFRRISILAVIREMRTFQTFVLIFVCIIHSYSQEAEVVKCVNCDYLYTSDYEFDFESIDSVAFKSFKENYCFKFNIPLGNWQHNKAWVKS